MNVIIFYHAPERERKTDHEHVTCSSICSAFDSSHFINQSCSFMVKECIYFHAITLYSTHIQGILQTLALVAVAYCTT